MKKVFGLFLLAFLLSAHAQPCLAESECHFPSRPYFDSVETELDSLLSLSFVRERFISPVNRAAEEPLLGPDDDRYFTPDDIKTIQHDWPMYIRSIVQKIFDTLLARGIDPDGYGSVYELLAEFFFI